MSASVLTRLLIATAILIPLSGCGETASFGVRTKAEWCHRLQNEGKVKISEAEAIGLQSQYPRVLKEIVENGTTINTLCVVEGHYVRE